MVGLLRAPVRRIVDRCVLDRTRRVGVEHHIGVGRDLQPGKREGLFGPSVVGVVGPSFDPTTAEFDSLRVPAP